MARTRYRIFDDCQPYFLTCTIVGWLPVFTRPPFVEFIYDAWQFAQRERELKLFGYVIMENHLHMIAAAPDLTGVIKKFKSFTARQMVDRLRELGDRTLLKQLGFHKLAHKTQSDVQVWQEGHHPQEIQGDPMMWQKLEYSHNNPIRRGYVDDPLHWRYSSARNYARQPGLIDVVTDWM
jgi:putative transposase